MSVQTVNLAIRGMTCANCARGVERKLSATPGVSNAAVDLQGASATVQYDAGKVTLEALAEAVRQLGYEVAA